MICQYVLVDAFFPLAHPNLDAEFVAKKRFLP